MSERTALAGRSVDDILKLTEAVWRSMDEKETRKIDWEDVQKRLSSNWLPNECQAIWRYVVYDYKKRPASAVNFAEDIDDEVSDVEQTPILINDSDIGYIPPPIIPTFAPIVSPTNTTSSGPPSKKRKTTNTTPSSASQSGAPSGDRKKRQLWSKDETIQLLSGIQQHGPGNWTAILLSSQGLNRTPSQLSQRWSAIKRKVQQGKSEDPAIQQMVESILSGNDTSGSPYSVFAPSRRQNFVNQTVPTSTVPLTLLAPLSPQELGDAGDT
eukprot:TRINITY_DN3073_c0_g1_i2.p1 TRINITY_DN3073_c0_g1~~TRINITY_DN3073_c0_g1_i2.p1  ORF type:complete len:296 (+),score=63.94 TRINITY_DN3073_c0_g1_i2:82-888(+)